MSDNSCRRTDQRVQRTRNLLAETLLSLGAGDADIDALDVSALTEVAGISRSTFYQHFASKEDFLIRSFVEMISSAEAAESARQPDRSDILPSRTLFAHIAGARGLAIVMTRSAVYDRQMAAAEVRLRAIADSNVARRFPDWSADRRREAAVFIAGAFVGMLRWWMDAGLRQSADRLQAAFERLAEQALTAALEETR